MLIFTCMMAVVLVYLIITASDQIQESVQRDFEKMNNEDLED